MLSLSATGYYLGTVFQALWHACRMHPDVERILYVWFIMTVIAFCEPSFGPMVSLLTTSESLVLAAGLCSRVRVFTGAARL